MLPFLEQCINYMDLSTKIISCNLLMNSIEIILLISILVEIYYVSKKIKTIAKSILLYWEGSNNFEKYNKK